jgi:hypothetical protein
MTTSIKFFIIYFILSIIKAIKLIFNISSKIFITYAFDFLQIIENTIYIYRYIIKKSTYYKKIKNISDNKFLSYTFSTFERIFFYLIKIYDIYLNTFNNQNDNIKSSYGSIMLIGFTTWFYYSLHLGSFIMFILAIIPIPLGVSVLGLIIFIYQLLIRMI